MKIKNRKPKAVTVAADQIGTHLTASAKLMLKRILQRAIEGLDRGMISDGYHVGIVGAHLEAIVLHAYGESEPFLFGLNGDYSDWDVSSFLQHQSDKDRHQFPWDEVIVSRHIRVDDSVTVDSE